MSLADKHLPTPQPTLSCRILKFILAFTDFLCHSPDFGAVGKNRHGATLEFIYSIFSKITWFFLEEMSEHQH